MATRGTSIASKLATRMGLRLSFDRVAQRPTAMAHVGTLCSCVLLSIGIVGLLSMDALARGVASAGTLPRIVSAPTHVAPGNKVVILADVPQRARCRLILQSGGSVIASALKRAPTGELEWTWLVPRLVAGGGNAVTIRCLGHRHVARATIASRHHGRSRGRNPIARHIRALAVRATEPPGIQGLGGAAYPSYGSVMVPAAAWFGGHGVDVVSNGYADNLTGHWQCVELVNRFLTSEHFGPAIYGNANQLYGDAPSNYYDHHPNGSGYVPVPGDIIVLGAGTQFGHVVVVDQVVSGTVYVVEQNASASGRNAIALTGSTLGREYGLGVIGVLHARTNTAAPAPPSTPPSSTSPPPQTGPIDNLGFIKLQNTGSGTVEVHLDSLQSGGLRRAADYTSDFSPGDAANGVWQLFGFVNGAPELGFIKLRNTAATVEVHWDTLQGRTYKRAGDFTSDFSPADAANGTWDLFDSTNGAPVLGFVKVRNTAGTVEAHWDTLQGSSYRRAGDFTSDFSPADATNGVWQLFGSANGAPELGFVKLQNTAGTVEVHWDVLQSNTYHRVGDFVSDFSPSDGSNGSWNLFGTANGAPELGFVKLSNAGSGTVEAHADVLQGSSYARTADYGSDFSPGDSPNGSWQIGYY
jgi:CHAP domain